MIEELVTVIPMYNGNVQTEKQKKSYLEIYFVKK